MGEAVENTSNKNDKDDDSSSVVVMTMSQVRRRSSMAGEKETITTSSSVADHNNNDNDDKDKLAVHIRRDTIALVTQDQEIDLAHNFQEHSYRAPTHCAMCGGLLVGLWSQGLQCTTCHLNVHRGGGVGDHDDCRAEAMFTPCCSLPEAEEEKSISEAIQELRQLAETQPNFFGDIRAQMDRDVMTHVADTIVTAGVEGEKSKKFLRAKHKIVPFLAYIDSIQDGGKMYALLLLMKYHIMLDIVAAAIGFVLMVVAIVSRHHDQITQRSLHLAMLHESTVLVTVHVALLLLTILLRHVAKLFHKKVVLIDRFLQEKFGIDAKQDFGVSVAGAAMRMQWWANVALLSASITCYAALAVWWAIQPFFDTLESMEPLIDRSTTTTALFHNSKEDDTADAAATLDMGDGDKTGEL